MRRSWFVWAIVVGVASVVLAAVVMRLTADDEGRPTAAEWADSVCSSLDTWKTSIESLADVDPGSLNADTLSAKVDEASEATSMLVADLQALEAPDLESGDELEQELTTAADDLQAGIDALEEGAEEAADAGSPQEFLQALAALAPQFQELMTSAQLTVEDLQNADISEDDRTELQAAFDGSEACQELRADS